MGGPGGSGVLGSPWLPEELGPAPLPDELERLMGDLRYCVVDEVVDDRAMLIASPWPLVDDQDRRVFPDRDADDGGDGDPWEDPYEEIGVPVMTLQRFLELWRNGPDVDRPVAIGDVYAMSTAALSQLTRQEEPQPAAPMPAPPAVGVVDVTRSARAAARSAFSRIVAPPSDADSSPLEPGTGGQGMGPSGALAGPPPGFAPAGGTGLPAPSFPPWLAEELSAGLTLAAELTGALTGQSPADVVLRTVPALRYCSVDEVVGDRAGMIVTAWPTTDAGGRRAFPGPAQDDSDTGRGTAYREVGLALGRLQEFLDSHRLPYGGPDDRPVRIGDVYAMTADALEVLEVGTTDDDLRSYRAGVQRPRHILDRLTVFDVTRSARVAAKAAFARIVAADDGPVQPHPDPDDDDPGSIRPAGAPDAPRGGGPTAGRSLDVPSLEELAAGIESLLDAVEATGSTSGLPSPFVRVDGMAGNPALHAAWDRLSARWRAIAHLPEEGSAVVALSSLLVDPYLAAVMGRVLQERGGGPDERGHGPGNRH